MMLSSFYTDTDQLIRIRSHVGMKYLNTFYDVFFSIFSRLEYLASYAVLIDLQGSIVAP
jgi:hypothetical protein